MLVWPARVRRRDLNRTDTFQLVPSPQDFQREPQRADAVGTVSLQLHGIDRTGGAGLRHAGRF